MSAAAAKTQYWVLGEFNDSDALLSGTTTLRQEKAGELDTYTAYPVPGIEEALGVARSKVTYVAFAGGLTGAVGAWALQLYFNYFNTWHGYAVNIANRPPHAPPVKPNPTGRERLPRPIVMDDRAAGSHRPNVGRTAPPDGEQ